MGEGGGICHHPLNLGLGVDSRHSQGRGCMMTVVVTISSSGVASITPRSALLDTIILRTELNSTDRQTEEYLLAGQRPHLEMLGGTMLQMAWEGEVRGGEEGFKFKQKIKHRQDHPGREVGSNISQMPSS